MNEKINELFNQILDNEELFENMANVYAMFFRSLVSAGFTEEQAMQIIISQNSLFPQSGGKKQ